MEDPRKTLAFALEKYPERLEIAPIERFVLEAARQNPRRPAFVKVAVPDELVKNLRGRAEDRDQIYLVRVPRDLRDRAESPIILPGEAG